MMVTEQQKAPRPKNNVSQPAPKKKILLSDIMIKKSWLTHVLTAALAGAAGVSAGLVL
jgi:hypothetical protein